MHRALADFIRDVPELAPHLVVLDRQAEAGDVNAAAKRGAIIWICEQSDRSLLEKVDLMQQLEHLPEGRVHLNMPQFSGWFPPGRTRTLQ